MCETCGCGQPGEPEHDHSHEHDHKHGHSHKHDHDHDHPTRVIDVQKDILSANNMMAERNRGFMEGRRVLCLNLVSSPGSGKTTVLERTLSSPALGLESCVIEGDQQTSMDAERISKAGARVIQVNTGTGCHLDAKMVGDAMKKLEIPTGGILFIENVGNLVCPALFDLGERKRVLVMSVTEGDDKPLKYPYMFASSQLCLINKTDLLPYVDFSVEQAISWARRVNPAMEFICLSARTGEGFDTWIEWLRKESARVP